jgi:hypothetical protein
VGSLSVAAWLAGIATANNDRLIQKIGINRLNISLSCSFNIIVVINPVYDFEKGLSLKFPLSI